MTLEKSFPERDVTAVDFSSAMLEAGKKRGITKRTTTVVGDAMNLPLPDATFAGALCSFGVRNIADQGKALRELRRVLKPGGIAVVLELFRPETSFTKLFHGLYANVVIPNMGRLVAGDRSSYEYLAKSMRGFMSRPEYEREMGLAGFVCVRGTNLMGGVAAIVRGETLGEPSTSS
ncbi:MAG: class I SAM-dependent methyltransferase [Polyangiaceae bacterium]